jgi:plasmid stability protein
MSQILIRNLSPETVERLKVQAKRSGRSLEAEVRVILEQAGRPRYSPEDFQRMTAEIRATAGPQQSDSTDLIREDRDR